MAAPPSPPAGSASDAQQRMVRGVPALHRFGRLIGEELEAAVLRFRHLNRRDVEAEHASLRDAIAEVKTLSRQGRTAYEQVRREKIVGGVFFLSGLMLLPPLTEMTLLWR